MMDRRSFLAGSVGLLAAPLAAEAQSVGRAYRVACVWAVPPAACTPYRVILEQRLRELGWISGSPGPELFAKQMELVKQLLPSADRILTIRNAEGDAIPQERAIFLSVQTAARILGLRLEVSGVRGAADIERVFDQVGRSRPSAVFAANDAFLFAHMPLIAKLALKQRLPSVFWFREDVDAG